MTAPALVFYVGNRNPSITQTITVNGTAFDLTGATVTFKMRAVGSSTLKVSAAATVVTAAAGTVRYDWLAADVDTEGFFVCWWTVNIGGKDEDVQEALLDFRPHAPDSGWLCELQDVRLLLELDPDSTDRDSLIRSLIPLASSRVIDYAESEFAPATASATRRFRVTPLKAGQLRARIDLAPYDLRTVASIVLHPETSGPYTLTTADYDLEPVTNKYGVYPVVKLSTTVSFGLWSAHAVQFGRANLDITGAWGFATVPDDAKRACTITVASWVDKAIGEYGIQNLDTLSRDVVATRAAGYDLPNEARKAVDHFRRRRVFFG